MLNLLKQAIAMTVVALSRTGSRVNWTSVLLWKFPAASKVVQALKLGLQQASP